MIWKIVVFRTELQKKEIFHIGMSLCLNFVATNFFFFILYILLSAIFFAQPWKYLTRPYNYFDSYDILLQKFKIKNFFLFSFTRRMKKKNFFFKQSHAIFRLLESMNTTPNWLQKPRAASSVEGAAELLLSDTLCFHFSAVRCPASDLESDKICLKFLQSMSIRLPENTK